MVVGIVAVVFLVHCGMHAAVFCPEEKPSTLEQGIFIGDTYLPEVPSSVPPQVVVNTFCPIVNASHRMGLVGVAITVYRFHGF